MVLVSGQSDPGQVVPAKRRIVNTKVRLVVLRIIQVSRDQMVQAMAPEISSWIEALGPDWGSNERSL